MKMKVPIESFADDFANPTYWIVTALQLFAVVELLQDKLYKEWQTYMDAILQNVQLDDVLTSTNYQRVQFMLAGYGFEAFFKHIYIKLNTEIIRSELIRTGTMPEILKTHDLVKLSTLVRYPLTLERQRFFQKLTIHSTWIGRYPVPTDVNKYSKSLEHLTWSSSDSDDFFEALYDCFQYFGLNYQLIKKRGGLTSATSAAGGQELTE
jgi:hypothetical protein